MSSPMLDCPVCGREMGCSAPESGRPWKPKHRWLLAKLLRVGLPTKVAAKVMHTTPAAVKWQIEAPKRKANAA